MSKVTVESIISPDKKPNPSHPHLPSIIGEDDLMELSKFSYVKSVFVNKNQYDDTLWIEVNKSDKNENILKLFAFISKLQPDTVDYIGNDTIQLWWD